MEPKILFEDSSIFVMIKPPKYPIQSDKTGDYDLLTYLLDYMKNTKNFENPYVGLVHRIDRPVGGVVVFGKNKKSTAFLSKQFQERTFKKKYLAVVNGHPKNDETLVNFLKKKNETNISRVVEESTPKSKKAILNYKVLEKITHEDLGELSLLEIELETGRHHQIRVQLSYIGFPLWGDTKYNDRFKNKRGWTQIALWAKSLSFTHPKTNKKVSYSENPLDMIPFNMFKNQL